MGYYEKVAVEHRFVRRRCSTVFSLSDLAGRSHALGPFLCRIVLLLFDTHGSLVAAEES